MPLLRSGIPRIMLSFLSSRIFDAKDSGLCIGSDCKDGRMRQGGQNLLFYGVKTRAMIVFGQRLTIRQLHPV